MAARVDLGEKDKKKRDAPWVRRVINCEDLTELVGEDPASSEISGSADRDDVLGFFQKMLAVIALLVVVLAGRQLVLELLALGLALWLPSASSPRLLSNAGERSGAMPR